MIVHGVQSFCGTVGGGEDSKRFKIRPTMIPMSPTKAANMSEKPRTPFR